MMFVIIAYPLCFLLLDMIGSKKKLTVMEYVVYGLLMAVAFLLCLASVQNWMLPNPIDGLMRLFHQN